MNYPSVDPIPLPAPVWLLQILYHLTTALHFTAVFALTGGLIMSLIWGVRSRPGSKRAVAAASVMRPLPTVMAYVINLGVPPLLFSQVLYGRPLYTASVILGTQWILVIPILMGAYFGLYRAVYRERAGRSWTWISAISLLLVCAVAFIYFQVMTLVQRPEAWQQLYESSAAGVSGFSDPLIHQKGQVFFAALLPTAGVLMLWAAMRRNRAQQDVGFLQPVGAAFTVVGPLLVLVTGMLFFSGQPEAQQTRFMEGTVGVAGMRGLQVAALALIALGVLQFKAPKRLFMILSTVLLVVFNGGITLVRGAFKDLDLARQGYEVAEREVFSNWSVVGLFVLLLLGALGSVLWMLKVFLSSRQEEAEGQHA